MRRVHFYEWFAAANFLAILLVAGFRVPVTPVRTTLAFAVGLVPYTLAGVAIRAAVAAFRRRRGYVRIVRSRAWIVETLRLILFSALAFFTYGWIKLAVPAVHPRLFDQELWDLDRLLFFGLSPNILFLDLFSARPMLRAIDWSYANIFYVSICIALAYFLSEPSRRVRVAFANGHAAMWLIGAWLYMLVPSVGPAYRFPDLWFPHEAALRNTQALQALLMRNYQNVLRVAAGQPATDTIRIVYGVAAFPSLHVGFQTYVFLWMRRVWTSGQVMFALFTVAIFLGSVVTGWHYVIDGIAGIVLAWACYAAASRASRMSRWFAIKAAI